MSNPPSFRPRKNASKSARVPARNDRMNRRVDGSLWDNNRGSSGASAGGSGGKSQGAPSFTPRKATGSANGNRGFASRDYANRNEARGVPPSYSPNRKSLKDRAETNTNYAGLPPRFAPQSGGGSTKSGRKVTSHSQTGSGWRPQDNMRLPPAINPRGRGGNYVPRAGGSKADAYANPTPTAPPTSFKMPNLKMRFGSGKRWVACLLVLIIAWPLALLGWAQYNLQHTDALRDGGASGGETYLIAGSDERDAKAQAIGFQHDTDGQRTDSLVLVRKAANGQASVVSIPRDTYTEIPDYGSNKINAAFALGGAPLLIQTVQKLTGVHVDHFALIGMGGVASVVDAIGGVNLCYDADVSDPKSMLEWKAGCHDVDGKTALAFSRMRYADPRGDVGRTDRQRQVIAKTIQKASSPTTFLNPFVQFRMAGATSSSITTDQSTGIIDLAKLALTYKSATSNKLIGAPPIENMGYATENAGSAVLLDQQLSPTFWKNFQIGTLTPDQFNKLP
ncbi:MAG: LCP family protein [Actinomycetaceae bacterium]|nr:LCP family protein [Actinomycetaceae bacterium]